MTRANSTTRTARPRSREGERSRSYPDSQGASESRDRYVALLRGINVGGNNLVKMTALKACFEDHGFTDVATYIQSGNVLFRTTAHGPERLTTDIEELLSEQFNYTSRVVVVSHQDLKIAVHGAPKGFGANPAEYRYDVIFLKAPLTAADAMKSVRVREGVDEALPGKGVLYFSRLIARASQSYLSRIVSLPIYKNMTIRNWNTTTKLLALMDAAGNGK